MLESNPLVSIIVPVYNVEKYLHECVGSILNQTISDYELILVDDGSTDESPQICDEYARKDQRIKVIHQKNQGVSAARNAGLSAAIGEYVGFLDSDDWLDQSFLQKCMTVIHSTNCDMCITGFHFYDDAVVNTRKAEAQNLIRSSSLTPKHVKEWMENCLITSSCSKLIRHSVIGGTRFDTKVNFGEDLRFCFEILNKDVLVFVLDWAGYYYRMTPNSLTSNIVNEKKCLSIVETYRFLYDHAKETGFWHNKEYMLFLDNRWCGDYFGTVYNILYSKTGLREKRYKLHLLMEDRELCDRINALEKAPVSDATNICLLYVSFCKMRIITTWQTALIRVKAIIKKLLYIRKH